MSTSEASEADKARTGEREAGSGVEWLETLEARVREATERLCELDADNKRLAARVEELEGELEAAREEGGGDGDEAEAWRRERKEIRARVENLTETLENLLRD